ncbi:hypothetical protein JZ751_012667, partial [Albula glossodonta]
KGLWEEEGEVGLRGGQLAQAAFLWPGKDNSPAGRECKGNPFPLCEGKIETPSVPTPHHLPGTDNWQVGGSETEVIR